MVDLSDKKVTKRTAVATGTVRMNVETLQLIMSHGIAKGDVFSTARIAGIMAAKKTADLIPLCHPLTMDSADIDFASNADMGEVTISAVIKTRDRTGAEMEALSAVTAAALTIYDMCKAADREMVITDIMLLEKTGGRSGHFKRKKGR